MLQQSLQSEAAALANQRCIDGRGCKGNNTLRFGFSRMAAERMLGRKLPDRSAGAHPIAADAEVAVAQRHRLLRADQRLLLRPIVDLRWNKKPLVFYACGTPSATDSASRVRNVHAIASGKPMQTHQDEIVAQALVLCEIHSGQCGSHRLPVRRIPHAVAAAPAGADGAAPEAWMRKQSRRRAAAECALAQQAALECHVWLILSGCGTKARWGIFCQLQIELCDSTSFLSWQRRLQKSPLGSRTSKQTTSIT